jgi:hypothetical protein
MTSKALNDGFVERLSSPASDYASEAFTTSISASKSIILPCFKLLSAGDLENLLFICVSFYSLLVHKQAALEFTNGHFSKII